MKISLRPVIILVILLASGPACASFSDGAPPPTATPGATATATITPAPTTTTSPTPSFTPPPTPSPTAPPQPVTAQVSVETLNLREGPGTTFARRVRLDQGTNLVLQGRAPGNEWVLGDTGQERGWMLVAFLQVDAPGLEALPVLDTGSAIVVQGRVVDASGAPVSLVTLALVQGSGANAPRTDALTLPDGSFYAYLPAAARDAWNLSVVGVDCRSPIMGADCQLTGKFSPAAIQVDLPNPAPAQFTYTP